MTSALQNRLVGTIIVVALVVILVPEFLDGEKRTNLQEFVDVPGVSELVKVESAQTFNTAEVDAQLSQAVEVIDEQALDEPALTARQNGKSGNDLQSEKQAANTKAVPKAVAPVIATVKAPLKDALADIAVQDSGWVVQLGSFKHQKNVKELLKTLTDAGYRAYSRPVMTSVGELTKVFVGPELDKKKLEQALPHLQEITKLKGKITAFEVSAG